MTSRLAPTTVATGDAVFSTQLQLIANVTRASPASIVPLVAHSGAVVAENALLRTGPSNANATKASGAMVASKASATLLVDHMELATSQFRVVALMVLHV